MTLAYHLLLLDSAVVPPDPPCQGGRSRLARRVQLESSRARRSGQQRGYVQYLSLALSKNLFIFLAPLCSSDEL